MKNVKLPGPESRIVVFGDTVFKLKYKLRSGHYFSLSIMLTECMRSSINIKEIHHNFDGKIQMVQEDIKVCLVIHRYCIVCILCLILYTSLLICLQGADSSDSRQSVHIRRLSSIANRPRGGLPGGTAMGQGQQTGVLPWKLHAHCLPRHHFHARPCAFFTSSNT